MDKPLVSIVCLTYNHKNYIRDALNGFVMQKTNFDFEVIIHDDASTDGTSAIIKEYARKYKFIVPILQKENQWSKGKTLSKTFIYPKIRGKYVAFCEGDDYWTDENKLQIQVNCLEDNPDAFLCFHPVIIRYTPKTQQDIVFPWPEYRFNKQELSLQDLLIRNFIQTNSVMYRWRFKEKNDFSLIPDQILPSDWYLHLLHAELGKVIFIDKTMGVYNKHLGGIWNNAENDYQWLKRYTELEFNFHLRVEEYFHSSRRSEITLLLYKANKFAFENKDWNLLKKVLFLKSKYFYKHLINLKDL